MPRGSSRRSSGSSFFSRPAATRTAAPAPSRNAPAPVQNRAPAPVNNAPAPAPSAGQPGMMSGIGSTIVQGMAFGTGSAIAHRAVDAVAGPRTVVHEFADGKQPEGDASQQAQGQSFAPAAAGAAGAAAGSTFFNNNGPCEDYNKRFSQCLQENNNQVSFCQFYFDALSQCQKDFGSK